MKLDQISLSTNSGNRQYPVMVNLKKGRVVVSDGNLKKMREMVQNGGGNLENFQELRESFSQQKVFYLS